MCNYQILFSLRAYYLWLGKIRQISGLILTFSYLKDDLERKLFFTETLMLSDDRLEKRELLYRELQIEVGSYHSSY